MLMIVVMTVLVLAGTAVEYDAMPTYTASNPAALYDMR